MVELTEKAVKLIDGKNFGYLATIMKDGSPQVTPVWVDREGRNFVLVNTAAGRLKERNAKRNQKVAIAMADSANQYEMVTIRGKVEEQTGTGADEHIDKLALKYIGKEKYPWRSPNEKRIILKIKANHISS